MNNSGNVRTIGGDQVICTVQANNAEAVTGPGRLYYILVDNLSAVDLYLCGWDATAVPADGAFDSTLLFICRVYAGTVTELNIAGGLPFTDGFVAAVSTSGTAMVAAGTSQCNFTLIYAKR